jgi:histidinol-phosphate aminotransferase
VPGEHESLADSSDLEGLVIVRSLTKTWALAGLRVGYVLAASGTIQRLMQAQPLWPVSTPAVAACVATAEPSALVEVAAWAMQLTVQRDHLSSRLATLAEVRVVPNPSASFLLLDTGLVDCRIRLQHKGFAVRRGETFPGLSEPWIRIAARDFDITDRFVAALQEVVGSG